MPAVKSHLVVRLCLADEEVLLEIKDHGIGVGSARVNPQSDLYSSIVKLLMQGSHSSRRKREQTGTAWAFLASFQAAATFESA